MVQKKFENRMTLGYVVGLLLIAALSFVLTLILYRIVDSEHRSDNFYDILSRQKVRVGRIALFAVDIAERESESESPTLRKDLAKETENLLNDHEILVNAVLSPSGLYWDTDPDILESIVEVSSYKALDREIKVFAASAKYLGRLDELPKNMDDVTITAVLDQANTKLRTMLDSLYNRYRTVQTIKNKQSKQVITASLAVIILVLIAEGIFLFRPLVNVIKKEKEEITKARDKADEANRIKSQFLANMSHEIRTPLTAILGYSEIIGLEANLSEEVRIKNQAIKKSASHLKVLIDDFLDYAKASESLIDVNLQTFPLFDLIDDVVSIMLVKAKEKNLNLKTKLLDDVPHNIESDPVRLKQLLFNLIGNAIKFTSEGSVELAIDYNRKSQILNFQVSDTGNGIAEKDQERIFTRFVQLDDSMTRQESGSGIGLSLSKVICEALGGSICLKSSNKFGSTFEISIPARAVVSEKDHHQTLLNTNLNNKENLDQVINRLINLNILLVEDGEENREIYDYFLKLAGATITIAVNGEEALDSISKSTFDIVLMDIQMPVMDGYEAAATMIDRGHDVPIIALTAHALKSEKEKCYKIGFSDYLAKPIDITTLVDTIARWTKQNKPGINETSISLQNEPDDRKSTFHSDKVYQPMLIKFARSLQYRKKMIEQNLKDKNWVDLDINSHKLKGAAATYGYPKMSKIAGEIERSVKAITEDELSYQRLSNQVQQLSELIDAVIEGIAELSAS